MNKETPESRANALSFKERLEHFMLAHYGTRKAFAEAVKTPISTINSYFSSRGSSPSIEFFAKLVEIHPELDFTWLISGRPTEGTKVMVVSEPSSKYNTANNDPVAKAINDLSAIIKSRIPATTHSDT